MRKIKVFSTKTSGVTEYDVDADNWGGLKAFLTKEGIYNDDMKAVVRETKTSFDDDAAVLPTGLGNDGQGNTTHDFTLFLQATKTKSGW